jgi:hypothetical protein
MLTSRALLSSREWRRRRRGLRDDVGLFQRGAAEVEKRKGDIATQVGVAEASLSQYAVKRGVSTVLIPTSPKSPSAATATPP